MEQVLIFYSASLGGFLFESDREAYEGGIGWPVDAVEISSNEYNQLLDGQASGMTISADPDGYPELVHADDNSAAAIEAQKQVLLKEADAITMVWRTELALGTISDEDKEKLKAWMQYYKAIQAIDPETPEAVFPPIPEV